MRRGESLLIFLFFVINASAEEMGIIKGVVKPSRVYIDGGKIYMSDDYKIKIYSRNNLSFIKEISRKGEGPGEFDMNPRLFFLEDSIFVWTTRKFMWLRKEGEPSKEVRLMINPFKILPVKDNLVLLKMEGGFYKISLYNEKLKSIKDLLQHQIAFSMNRVNPFEFVLDFHVENKKVIVGKRDENLLKVFDDKVSEVKVIRTSLPRFKMED